MIFRDDLKPGDCVLLPSRDRKKPPHLWTVLTPPKAGKVIIVNFTTKRDFSDPSTVLNVGDHPFVKHLTVIDYYKTQLVNVAPLKEGIKNGWFSEHSALKPEILRRVQEGLLKSPHTPKKIKLYYQQNF